MLTFILLIYSCGHSYVGAIGVDVKTHSKMIGHFRIRPTDSLQALGEKKPIA